MAGSVRARIRHLRDLARTTRQLNAAAALSTLREEYRHLLESERFRDPLRLNRHGYSLYSQADEDGIIHEIFRRVGTTNRVFVEIGCGDGLTNNTHALLLNGWSGLWVDADESGISAIRRGLRDQIGSGQLSVERSFVTAENVNEVVGAHVQQEVDLLSIDIDGNDFHVLAATRVVRPRVVVVEYNARKGPSLDWVMNYDPRHVWKGDDHYGASLKAFEKLMCERGLELVGCSISGVNAFFVAADLVDATTFHSPFTSEEHYEPQRRLLRLGVHTAHKRSFGSWTSARGLLGLED